MSPPPCVLGKNAPSTYYPTKQGDFELLIFTDDDHASLGRIDPSTWHYQVITAPPPSQDPKSSTFK